MSKIINIQVEVGDSKSITQELTQVGSTLVRIKCEEGLANFTQQTQNQ